ncbi:nuclear transport factor 2 family protein [Kitasatospora sp. CB01950]|uniref:nuclear transport factor 2 family protein n=1 Tax=Kitasatospora sp. CB01950 TaxID=1703930 RepID=UPI000939097B|nr:nuclear transport factor 2 family protein [Kitasatospora sp. CB01950]OKJ16943.1 hypothetical protein AMK19_02070 [Kitasatospora sp. CB01950]
MTDPNEFARRYVRLWHEPDPVVRREGIAAMFAPDARHFTPWQVVCGHEELEARIGGAYERWVAPGEYLFRAAPHADGHHGTVRFGWEMVERASGAVVSVGFDFVVFTEDGLIRSDHQFLDF